MSLSGKPTTLEDAVLSSDTGIDPNAAIAKMPTVLSQLVDAEFLLNDSVNIDGTFFVEIMAGECVATLGVIGVVI